MHRYVKYVERIIKQVRQNINNRWIWVEAYASFKYNSCNFSIIFKIISILKGAKIFRVVIENMGSGVGLTGLKFWICQVLAVQPVCASVSLPAKWS